MHFAAFSHILFAANFCLIFGILCSNIDGRRVFFSVFLISLFQYFCQYSFSAVWQQVHFQCLQLEVEIMMWRDVCKVFMASVALCTNFVSVYCAFIFTGLC